MTLDDSQSNSTGTPDEPRAIVLGRKIALFTLKGLIIVALPTLLFSFSSFIPGPQGMTMGFFGAALCGLIGAMGGTLPIKESPVVTDQLRLPIGIRIPLFAVLLFFLGYICFVNGLPAFYTLLFGAPGEQRATVYDWTGSGKACHGPNFEEARFSGHVCLDRSLEKSLPPGKVVTLVGRATFLGIIVHSVRW